MLDISRRKFVRDLGCISGAGLLSTKAFGLPTTDPRAKFPAVSPEFYVILPGSWVIVFDKQNNVVRALTTDRGDHQFDYAVTTDANVTRASIPINTTFNIAVQGHTAATSNALLQPMIDYNQGILFNDQVQVSSNAGTRTDLRTISLPMPTEIHTAALIGSSPSFISVDGTNTLQSVVNYLPGTLAFVYSGWTTASLALGSTNLRSFSSSSGGAHVQFRICPKLTCDQPIPCDQNFCTALGKQEQHAKDVLTDLLGLLTIKSGNKPSFTFPACTLSTPGITVDRGYDSNLSLSEIGMFVSHCRHPEIGSLHTCAAGGIIVGG